MRAAVIILFVCFNAAWGQTGNQWEEVSPEEAEAHIMARGPELVYPAFAKAAGIEGTVRIGIGIYLDGRIHSVAVQGGPPALQDAAVRYISQATYRPFEKDGHPIGAETTVEVVFNLPPGTQKPPRKPPHLTIDTFQMTSENPIPQTTLSRRFQKWIAAQMKDLLGDTAENTSTDSLVKPQLVVHRLPLQVAGARLYIVQYRAQQLCGATGNCQIDLIEENANEIHRVALDLDGWGYYVRQMSNSSYPEVFFIRTGGGGHHHIAGYSHLAGKWGQIYSGSISLDDDDHETLTWNP